MVTNVMQILVHGEIHNMMRLKSKLLSLNQGKKEKDKVKIFSPKNAEELLIPFKADKVAKVVGRLAQVPPPTENGAEEEDHLLTGVLVQNDFKLSLMAPEDLREYAGLTTTTITCKQRLTLSAAGVDLIKWALEGTFGSIEELHEGDKMNGVESNGESITNGNGAADKTVSYLVMGAITVRCQSYGAVELEWDGNMLNDGIADAVMAVLLTVESSPAAVRRELPLLSTNRLSWIPF
jgi:cleavage and polyadenylation specificity factor subunit 3